MIYIVCVHVCMCARRIHACWLRHMAAVIWHLSPFCNSLALVDMAPFSFRIRIFVGASFLRPLGGEEGGAGLLMMLATHG